MRLSDDHLPPERHTHRWLFGMWPAVHHPGGFIAEARCVEPRCGATMSVGEIERMLNDSDCCRKTEGS